MARGRGVARSNAIVRWLLPASLLHVALFLLAPALSPGARPTPDLANAQFSWVEPGADVELTLLHDESEWQAARAAPGPHFDRARPMNDGVGPQPPHAPGGGTRSRLSGTAREALALAHDATQRLPARDEPPAATAAHALPPEAAAPLSLDQLGIGANPFLGVAVEPVTKAAQANARLQAALHPSSLDSDQRSGLGPAGPVAAAARRLVLANEALVESSAVLNVRVDGAGHVTEVQMLEASSQLRAWQWVAAQLTKTLHPVTLRAADSQQGWAMKLRLASRVLLPSGAAPGMTMGVLGQQLAGSGGPGSTSLELSPSAKLDLEEPIDSTGRHLDRPVQFEVMLLKFRADLADIGGTARRVVEVAVLSIDEPATP
jgi:hypothetical protein